MRIIKLCLLLALFAFIYWRGYHYGYRLGERDIAAKLEPYCEMPEGKTE